MTGEERFKALGWLERQKIRTDIGLEWRQDCLYDVADELIAGTGRIVRIEPVDVQDDLKTDVGLIGDELTGSLLVIMLYN